MWGAFALVVAGAAGVATAQVSPPDLNVCSGTEACDAPATTCREGFTLELLSYQPGAGTNAGSATYTYEVCSPPAGTCTLDPTRSCLDDTQCSRQSAGTCSRTCSTETFRDLSHFDVVFPELGLSCLSSTTEVSGTCRAVDNTPNDGATASVGPFVKGDGSCGTASSPFAKCDSTSIAPGDCVRMSLTISGELNGLGLGAGVMLTKEANQCTSSCIQGPSCEPCDDPPGEACLTRTIGFWGTHPWIANDYAPVTVCGRTVGCSGAGDGKSFPSCGTGSCTDLMEALGSIPSELPSNQAYVSLVRQLAAAKLNLTASSTLSSTTCTTFSYGGKNIQQWIAACEALCGESKGTISASGCTTALDAFNNSQDTGLTSTPAPFDRPSVDDFGNVSGADPSGFTGAQRNGCVVGKSR